MSLVFLYISDAIVADFNRNIQVVKGKIWMLCYQASLSVPDSGKGPSIYSLFPRLKVNWTFSSDPLPHPHPSSTSS